MNQSASLSITKNPDSGIVRHAVLIDALPGSLDVAGGRSIGIIASGRKKSSHVYLK
jgi:hypothetical protein